jgi:hypothetical protein
MAHVVGLAGPAGSTLQQLRELLDLLDTRRLERGLVQLRAGGDVVETTELRPSRAGGAPAEIVDRWTWPSTDGPVEHVKTMCVNGHGFTPMLDTITTQPAPAARPTPAIGVPAG